MMIVITDTDKLFDECSVVVVVVVAVVVDYGAVVTVSDLLGESFEGTGCHRQNVPVYRIFLD